jgi:hypothetical protein
MGTIGLTASVYEIFSRKFEKRYLFSLTALPPIDLTLTYVVKIIALNSMQKVLAVAYCLLFIKKLLRKTYAWVLTTARAARDACAFVTYAWILTTARAARDACALAT